ncbi:redoxin domain-containing protein [Naumannella cuiyingiana]|uniref:Peroxiredoxin n=1 Tax=Naumannella cuiyingiana TaxID=1347891 RepID=A0A7Z0D6Q4_9ACTN|nr:peroxiredoxin [Naumannella cuiyingiana]
MSTGGAPAAGDPAPDFTRPDAHGTPVTLSEALGQTPVLLVFYPFAFTGTCTGELARLAELHPEFLAAGVRPMTMSCDAPFSQRVFGEAERLPFPMLSDFWPHGDTARAYGVFEAERGCAVRGSFLIGRDGVVAWSVVNPIGAARDIDDHLARARALGD